MFGLLHRLSCFGVIGVGIVAWTMSQEPAFEV